MSAFLPRFDQLPNEIPIFPLPGSLLLPGGSLPLRIFEPRYLNMINDALSGHRLIGMIQPKGSKTDASGESENSGLSDDAPAVFPLGCAGRITSFTETDDGHYMIDLSGIARFSVREELAPVEGYRRVSCDFSAYRQDLIEAGSRNSPEEQLGVSPDMLATIKRYFDAQNIDADLESIAKADLPHLVVALSMSCPFSTLEKQALLEAENATQRIQVLTSLMEMASIDSAEGAQLN